MRSSLARQVAHIFREAFLAQSGACGRLLLSWTMAGGIAAGGVLIVGLLGAALFWHPREALGFDLQLVPFAAVLLGVGAACSLGFPLVCALHGVRRRLSPSAPQV